MIFRSLALVLLVGLAASAARAAPNPHRDGPPAGIVPTTATLAEVLALHRAAVGKPALAKAPTRERWHMTYSGLEGTQTTLRYGNDYVSETTLGPLTTRDGSFEGKRWRQDANGITVALHDVHRANQVSNDALAHADDPRSGVLLLGETREPAAYVLEVHPAGGRHQFLFYDKTSGLTLRREEVVIDQRVVTVYDDYRLFNGQPSAYHIHSSDGRDFNESDLRAEEKTQLSFLDANVFARPPNRRKLTQFPAGQTSVILPATFQNGRIIAHLDVNGTRADFLLDSGASSIVVDRGLIAALGLPQFGRRTGSTAGTYVASQAIIPRLQFGDLTMHDLAVSVLPERFHPAPGTAVVGLLGFDFLASVALAIDYQHATLTAYDPATFSAPASATPLPALLDDGQPMIAATMNGAPGDRFIVDTGDDRTLLYTRFLRAHPEAFVDERRSAPLLTRVTERMPVGGVGGSFSTRTARLHSVAIGPYTFENHLVNAMAGSSALEYEDHDGLIGHDLLGYFTVYLDYAHEQLLFTRNAVKP